ncbi:3-isopropylmalate dehydrogenase [Alphaproteobacteria bacterium]|jgi:3-isopropylmalate dehydrogenase|nr:3-isopropylmalate dehydrogenase [Alphaproteobacteria bacterium]|tara:strand:+ start:2128 stop:3210 length:1083 start_codon:yes stop_codon:yes gene_type:complete
MSSKILVLPGDGIGVEVADQTIRVIEKLNEQGLDANYEKDLVGGASYDVNGEPLTEAVLEKAKNSDAILLGAVGGSKWDDVERSKRPEAGLLGLRKELELFANLRPALVFDALVDASTLKNDVVNNLDIMIVRELTGGVYFGQPRGIEDTSNGKKAIDTQVYHDYEIDRIARVAFDLASKRNNKVTSVEKANVMETGVLWREVVKETHKDFSDITLENMLADNCAMQLVRNPKQFDVIVTDNLFGDLLSDCAAMLTGSLGMLPSASLGAEKNGKRYGLFEPVHGSAPDIAGQDKANPIATILSLSMMLKYNLNKPELSNKVENAVQQILSEGYRTGDIYTDENQTLVSCSKMGDLIIERI